VAAAKAFAASAATEARKAAEAAKAADAEAVQLAAAAAEAQRVASHTKADGAVLTAKEHRAHVRDLTSSMHNTAEALREQVLMAAHPTLHEPKMSRGGFNLR
tara:strand:- start:432 stop:737 length:306 start_codon:yes stop_codon:yes gene_type:complete